MIFWCKGVRKDSLVFRCDLPLISPYQQFKVTAYSFVCPRICFKSIPLDFLSDWRRHCVVFHNSRVWRRVRAWACVLCWTDEQGCAVHSSAKYWFAPFQRCVLWEMLPYCVFWMRESSTYMNEPWHWGNADSQVITGLYFPLVNRGEGRIQCMLFCFPVSWARVRVSSFGCNMRVLLPLWLLLRAAE